MGSHKIDEFRAGIARSCQKITFVFSVFIVHEDDHLAGAHIVKNVRNTAKGHRYCLGEGCARGAAYGLNKFDRDRSGFTAAYTQGGNTALEAALLQGVHQGHNNT